VNRINQACLTFAQTFGYFYFFGEPQDPNADPTIAVRLIQQNVRLCKAPAVLLTARRSIPSSA
jgi:hypothetical protein